MLTKKQISLRAQRQMEGLLLGFVEWQTSYRRTGQITTSAQVASRVAERDARIMERMMKRKYYREKYAQIAIKA